MFKKKKTISWPFIDNDGVFCVCLCLHCNSRITIIKINISCAIVSLYFRMCKKKKKLFRFITPYFVHGLSRFQGRASSKKNPRGTRCLLCFIIIIFNAISIFFYYFQTHYIVPSSIVPRYHGNAFITTIILFARHHLCIIILLFRPYSGYTIILFTETLTGIHYPPVGRFYCQ